jgi:hypothetical protein
MIKLLTFAIGCGATSAGALSIVTTGGSRPTPWIACLGGIILIILSFVEIERFDD